MHVFDYSFLDTGLLPAEMVTLTSTIAAFNAISNERKEQNKSVYTELEKIARIQSVKGSNAIEGIVTTDVRIKAIVNGNSAPLNHSEREIAGYRDALDEIHTGFELMPISENTILHLHQVMTSAAGYDQSGQYKAEDNLIMEVDMRGRRRVRFEPVSAAQTGEAMEQLILAYMDARDNPRISKLLLIPCVILDFLCIHPFADGNGRVFRLLTLLLLYKSGYDICRYASFEEQINLSKDYYYESLRESSEGWHTNKNSYVSFMKNFLSINDIKTLLKPISERYFDGNNKVSMEEIYKTLSNSEEEMTDFIKSDIIREINKSKEMFLDNPKKDTDYLQLFALVTGLTYDIYVKKQMIESIVDQINKYEEKTSKDKKKE